MIDSPRIQPVQTPVSSHPTLDLKRVRESTDVSKTSVNSDAKRLERRHRRERRVSDKRRPVQLESRQVQDRRRNKAISIVA